MWAEDIEGSKAHAQMLFEVGLLTESEKNQIIQGLTSGASTCRWLEPGVDQEDIPHGC